MADYNNISKKKKNKKQESTPGNSLDNLIQWNASRRVQKEDTTTLPSSYTEVGTLNSKLLDFEFKIDEFAMRGLNKYRNFLTSPDCDCGCGGKGRPVFDTREELIGFCGSILFDMDCSNCAIFLVHKDGKQEAILKMVEWDEDTDDVEEHIASISTKDNTADSFAIIDAEYGLHCYGLMIEKEDGVWMICE